MNRSEIAVEIKIDIGADGHGNAEQTHHIKTGFEDFAEAERRIGILMRSARQMEQAIYGDLADFEDGRDFIHAERAGMLAEGEGVRIHFAPDFAGAAASDPRESPDPPDIDETDSATGGAGEDRGATEQQEGAPAETVTDNFARLRDQYAAEAGFTAPHEASPAPPEDAASLAPESDLPLPGGKGAGGLGNPEAEMPAPAEEEAPQDASPPEPEPPKSEPEEAKSEAQGGNSETASLSIGQIVRDSIAARAEFTNGDIIGDVLLVRPDTNKPSILAEISKCSTRGFCRRLEPGRYRRVVADPKGEPVAEPSTNGHKPEQAAQIPATLPGANGNGHAPATASASLLKDNNFFAAVMRGTESKQTEPLGKFVVIRAHEGQFAPRRENAVDPFDVDIVATVQKGNGGWLVFVPGEKQPIGIYNTQLRRFVDLSGGRRPIRPVGPSIHEDPE